MATLFLDIFSGISGDMFLGAMIDLGVKFDVLEGDAAVEESSHDSTAGSQDVSPHSHRHHPEQHRHHEHHRGDTQHHHAHHHDHDHSESRDFAQIRELIATSQLSDWVKKKAVAVFHHIAVAEGKIHGKPPEQVHFHEVGAIDSIVDIVGACIAWEILGQPRVLASPPVDGTGWVRCVHGRFPVPTPATLEMLGARQIPLTQCDEPHELITPTGAALLAEFVERFGPMEGLVANRIGYGLGKRENVTRPNVLRAILSETEECGKADTV